MKKKPRKTVKIKIAKKKAPKRKLTSEQKIRLLYDKHEKNMANTERENNRSWVRYIGQIEKIRKDFSDAVVDLEGTVVKERQRLIEMEAKIEERFLKIEERLSTPTCCEAKQPAKDPRQPPMFHISIRWSPWC